MSGLSVEKPVTRPVLRYHGGKWLLGQWIIDQFPAHRMYVEPYGGAANVLLQKPMIPAEIYNDLEGAVVNVFRVLQDADLTAQLRRRLFYTTFSREEFDRSYEDPAGPVDFACKTIVRSFFGFGTDSITRSCRTGFRARGSDYRAMPSAAWREWQSAVPSFVDRMRGVTIESVDALEVIQRYDSSVTLFYVDPPYVASSRSSLKGRGGKSAHGYRYELTDDDHRALAAVLRNAVGMVVLSGYDTPLYDELYGDWLCTRRSVLADSAKPRTECLWFNPAAAARRPQPSLMEACA